MAEVLEQIETETAAKNADTVRKLKNFVKNLRRDVRKFQAIQSNPESSQYQKRRALAEKKATQKVVTRLENLLA